MKRSKKTVLIVLCVVLLTVGIGVLCIVLQVAPTVNHALRIAELLQPVIEAKNQTMHLATSAEFDGEVLAMESDVYLVTEDDTSYLALEQNSNAVYISGNVLFLENGKAFKLGDTMQPQVQSPDALLPQIGALYEVLKITTEETDSQRVYSVTVTGEQVKTLLEAAALGEALPVEKIEKLKLQLTEKDGKLDQISFSGSGNADGAAAQLQVTLSGFRILAAGDYPIPEAVKASAATVDPDALFSLSEDLYRLVLALAPFADTVPVPGITIPNAKTQDTDKLARNNWMREEEIRAYEEECKITYVPKKYTKYAGPERKSAKRIIKEKYDAFRREHKYICGSSSFPFGSGVSCSTSQGHRKICKKTELPHAVTVHGLRHTYVTHYYIKHKNDPDFDLAAFSKSIGHSSIRTTMEIYAHLDMTRNRFVQR